MAKFVALMKLIVFGVLALAAGYVGAQLALSSGASNGGISAFVPSFAPMLKKVIPAVVTLRVTGEQYVPFEVKPLRGDGAGVNLADVRTRTFRTGGSGVIIDAARGLIVTNHHVVHNATSVDVGLSDGRRVLGKLIGQDPGTDLAVVQIELDQLPSIAIGVSDDMLVGDLVIAVGNPFGLEGTATVGIVGAVMRTEIGFEAFEDFLQIDAHIDPGNSGGALVNIWGELIGINTLVGGKRGGSSNIGFAIPIDMVRAIADEIIKNGRVRRGSLGLIVTEVENNGADGKSAQSGGAKIVGIAEGSAVGEAGPNVGDTIIRVGNKPIRNVGEFMMRTAIVPLGRDVTVTFRRQREDIVVSVNMRVSEIAMPSKVQSIPESAGKLAGALVGDIQPGHPLYGQIRGVVIADVPSGSRAADSGLQAGDVIVEIEKEKIGSVAAAFERLENTGSKFQVNISRQGVPGWLHVER